MAGLQGAVLGALAALFLCLGTIIYLQHLHAGALEAKYEQSLQSEATLRTENSDWKNAVGRQNLKLKQLAERQDALSAKAAQAVKAAKEAARHSSELAEKIMALPRGTDDCKSASAVKDFYLTRAR